jgi:tetratricopeptide (TPR) repeat protein
MSSGTILGRRFGPYEITRLIGAGGMGSVYLAERVDQQFSKQVAIKLISAQDSSSRMIEQFLQERETLAALDHPNIVRLLDGGMTEDGLPYFIMDYVEGTPIDICCNQMQLSLDERLNLFTQVCSAVQYAHRSAVVHRDIKPRNIIVTADGIPKLLDFGISKLLKSRPKAMLSETTQSFRTFTLEYASPEQIRSQPITTAVDIYALGVLLYELLTGEWPYVIEVKSEIALAYAICEAAPRPPSAAVNDPKLRQKLQGDLDAIILKAIAKKPEDRYGSVAEFAEDLARHSKGLPVLARPQTAGYRLQRFLARNRAVVAAGALACVIAAAGLFGTIQQSRVAQREMALAQRRYGELKSVLGAFLFEVHDNIRDLPGSSTARGMIIDQTAKYLGWLAQEAQEDDGLQLDLADAYLKMAGALGDPFETNLGKTKEAMESLEKASTVAKSVLARSPGDPRARRYVGLTELRRAAIIEQQGNPMEALEAIKNAVPTFQQLAVRAPDSIETNQDLAIALESLGDLYARLGMFPKGIEALEEALAAWRAVIRKDPKNFRARRAVFIEKMKLGNVYVDSGDVERAQRHIQESLDGVDALYQETRRPELKRLRALLLGRFAFVLWQRREYDAAVKQFHEQQRVLTEMSEIDPNDSRARSDLAMSYKNQIDLLWNLDRIPEAIVTVHSALALMEKLAAADPGNTVNRMRLASTLIQAGYVLHEGKRTAEARTMTHRGLALYEELVKQPDTEADYYYAEALLSAEPSDLRNLPKALVYAEKAAQLTKGGNLFNLDLLARTLAANHHYARALEVSEQALAKLPPDQKTQLRDVFENHVKEYREKLATTHPQSPAPR